MVMRLHIQREPDQVGMRIDEPIPFGLAVTVTMPGLVEIYEHVRQRLGLLQPVQPFSVQQPSLYFIWPHATNRRSEQRRLGNVSISTCRSRASPYHQQQTHNTKNDNK